MKKNEIKKLPAVPELKLWGYPALWYGLAAVWAGFVAYYYLKAYPIRLPYLSVFFAMMPGGGFDPSDLAFPLRYLREIVVAAAVILSAYGWGSILNRLLKFDREQTFETGIIRIGVGFLPLMYGVLTLGFLHVLYRGAVGGLLLAGLIGGIVELFLNRARLKLSVPSTRFLPKVLVLLVLCGLFYALIGALSPETFYDSLKYHLAVPRYWIQHHAIFAIPNFEYSYYPVNVHLVYLVTLMFGNDISAKLIHFLFGVMTALAVYSWAKRRFSVHTGILAAAVFLLTPLVLMVMTKTAIELGLAFFETLAVLTFLNFLDREEGGMRWLVLSAVFCGAAMGSKYLSAYCFVGLFVLLVLHLAVSRAAVADILKKTVLFAVIALLLPSPYLIRNYLLSGKPAYPYGVSLGRDITATVKGQAIEFNDPPLPGRTVRNFFTLPWTVAMGTQTQEPFSGALLLLLLPLPFLFRGTDRRIKFLAGYVLLYYALWFLLRPYFRYGIPFVPAAALLFAYFVMEAKIHRYARNFLLLTVIVLGTSNILLAVSVELMSQNPWGVVKGAQTRMEYLSTDRPSYPNAYYKVIDWTNKNLPADATILFMGECRGYYSERKFIVQTIGDFNPLLVMMQGVRSADELYDVLQKKGITHILLSIPEARRLAGYDTLHFEPDQMRVFVEFWNKYIAEIHHDIGDLSMPERGIYSMQKQQPQWWQRYASDPQNYIYVYAILPKEDARRVHLVPPNRFLTPALYPPERWEKLKTVTVAY